MTVRVFKNTASSEEFLVGFQVTSILSSREIRYHFSRFFGSAVPAKCFGPIIKAFQHFMECLVDSMKEVQEQSGMGWNKMTPPVVKMLLEEFGVLPEVSLV